MASLTSGKMACFNWFRNIFAGPLLAVMHYGSNRVILQLNANKLRKSNSKTQKIIYECESKEKHFENSLIITDTIWNDLFLTDEN